MRRTAALIVGGGPAGCSAAIRLGRAGLRPLLIERSQGPRDVVCGGFLGWDALLALRTLGIDPEALGARPIRRLRLVTARGAFETRLPHAAAGLSRRTLDTALLAAAAAAGAEVERGRTARAADLGGRLVRLDDGAEIAADAILLATGKHELRGAERDAPIAHAPLGLRTGVAAGEGLEGAIELHLFDGGYAGLLVQEDGRANLCLSVSRARMKSAGGVEPLMDELASELPAFGRRLSDPGAWTAVAGVPYGWRTSATDPGVYRVGDQAAVIASLAGDGIAIALASGARAAEALARGEEAESFQSAFARRSARPVRVAEALRRAAEHGPARLMLMGLLGWAPGLAPLAARLTRIGSGVIRRGGGGRGGCRCAEEAGCVSGEEEEEGGKKKRVPCVPDALPPLASAVLPHFEMIIVPLVCSDEDENHKPWPRARQAPPQDEGGEELEEDARMDVQRVHSEARLRRQPLLDEIPVHRAAAPRLNIACGSAGSRLNLRTSRPGTGRSAHGRARSRSGWR